MRTQFIALLLLATNAVALADDNPRTVSVSGKATVTAQPDIARISMSVIERNKSLTVAQQSASATSAKILRLLDRLKIDRKYIDTTGLNIRPDYRWNRAAEQQELIGYVVERQIMVELRNLDNLGKLLEGAVDAGANQVSPPGFDRTDRADLHRQALADAVRDARANAGVMAAAAGAELGAVMTINSSGMPSQPRPMMRAMAADAVSESAAESYVTGDIRFEAFVNIVYELAQ